MRTLWCRGICSYRRVLPPSSMISWDFNSIHNLLQTAPSYQTSILGDLFTNVQQCSWVPTRKRWPLVSTGDLSNWANTVKWMPGLCKCAPVGTCLCQDSSAVFAIDCWKDLQALPPPSFFFALTKLLSLLLAFLLPCFYLAYPSQGYHGSYEIPRRKLVGEGKVSSAYTSTS